LYNACSSECFGDVGAGTRCSEQTPFKPISPYAVAKASAFWMTSAYREAYGLFACSGILFNHESPLRPERFVTRKIVSGAVQIARGDATRLRLGNLAVSRDWGYAPEYVDAMWRMLQQAEPRDFVVATGQSNTLEAFVEGVFNRLDLKWRDHVDYDESLLRPSDIRYSAADPSLAKAQLDWQANTDFDRLIDRLVEAQLREPARWISD
jgi:GDPmannose 4,6-dehydratase